MPGIWLIIPGQKIRSTLYFILAFSYDYRRSSQAKMGVKNILAYTGRFYFILAFPYDYMQLCQAKMGFKHTIKSEIKAAAPISFS